MAVSTYLSNYYYGVCKFQDFQSSFLMTIFVSVCFNDFCKNVVTLMFLIFSRYFCHISIVC